MKSIADPKLAGTLWRMRRKGTRMKEVAKRSGVCQATITMVLQQRPVSEKVLRRVEKAVESLR